MHEAAENGHVEVVTILIAKGADVNAKNVVRIIVVVLLIIE